MNKIIRLLNRDEWFYGSLRHLPDSQSSFTLIVITRKVSFCSQSDVGAQSRGVLMRTQSAFSLVLKMRNTAEKAEILLVSFRGSRNDIPNTLLFAAQKYYPRFSDASPVIRSFFLTFVSKSVHIFVCYSSPVKTRPGTKGEGNDWYCSCLTRSLTLCDEA
jgi:hypothetical protein